MPIAHKDIFCTDGIRTTCSSKMLSNFVAPYDATVVERWRAAGTVLLGKTNMDEFAMGSSNETSFYGPVRNPWDHKRVPGGSSGGSAAAVAACIAPAATGTDTGGSIRQPAALTNLTGHQADVRPRVALRHDRVRLEPRPGRRAGAFGRGRRAAARGHGGLRSAATPPASIAPVPDYAAELNQPLKGLRVGIIREFFDEGLEPAVEKCVRAAIDELQQEGAVIKDVSLPSLPLSVPTYYVVAPAECSSNLSRFDGVRFGHRCEQPKDLLDLYKRSRGEGFGAEVKRRIMTGTYVLSAGYYDAYYLQGAEMSAQLIADDFARAFSDVDVVLEPDGADRRVRARRQDQRSDRDVPERHLHDRREPRGPAGASRFPAASSTKAARTCPSGLQLVGPHFGESRLLAVRTSTSSTPTGTSASRRATPRHLASDSG